MPTAACSRARLSVRAVVNLLICTALLSTACADGTGPEADRTTVRQQVTVAIQANDLAYDSRRGIIYASVASTSPQYANTIAAISPADGRIQWTVPVGSDPGVLDLSDDAAVLWIGLRGAPSIQRVELGSRTAGAAMPLGSQPFYGPLYAEDVEVLPGASTTVAVSLYRRGISPKHGGVAIYDDGVRRPTTTQDHTGSNVIEVVGETTLYGFNNESTEFGLRRLLVDATGVRQVSVVRDLVRWFHADMAVAGGRLFFTNGAVVDAATGTLVGTIPARGLVRPDASAERAYFLEGTLLQSFDMRTLARNGQAVLADSLTATGSLTLAGRTGLAFRTATRVVVVPLGILKP